jgi:hypothetical protein
MKLLTDAEVEAKPTVKAVFGGPGARYDRCAARRVDRGYRMGRADENYRVIAMQNPVEAAFEV